MDTRVTKCHLIVYSRIMKFVQVDMRYIIYFLVHLILVTSGALLVVMPSDFEWVSPLGLSLLASGISGYVVFVYVIMSQRVSDQLDALRSFGLVHVFSSRATRIKAEYDKRLARAKSQIDVLAFGLSSLLEDLGDEFPRWKARAQVRILLIDPDYPDNVSVEGDSSLADLRDRDEGRDLGTIRSDVVRFVRETSDLRDAAFQVRLYRCLPTVNIFRVDGEMFWGPYLVKEQGRNTPTFLVRHGVMYDTLLRHFNNIWESSEFSREPPADWT